MKVRHGLIPAASALFLTLAPSAAAPVCGQAASADPGVDWTLLDAVGYGGLGFGAGVMGAWDLEGEDIGPPPEALAIILVSTLAGVSAGAVVGQRARRSLAAGRPLTAAHRAAALGGVVLAGGTLGALAAVPLIDPSGEGTFLGSDERTFVLTTASGLALGALYAWWVRDQLESSAVRVTPMVPGDGGVGLRVRVPVRWNGR